ncbi:hypothetical protein [Actinoallomurus sp. CA-142502]|uniref:hypothetical protein n=1 Tax=Actinoallomurus sp. CA-142502 TaxID=3239885 RepID=UPI003D89C058
MTVTDRRSAAVPDEELARVRLSRRTILLLPPTCGVAVGNTYLPWRRDSGAVDFEP